MNKIIFNDARNMKDLEDNSIDCVVTSPPYPMIAMWDELFTIFNKDIFDGVERDPYKTFELMHKEMDLVWHELFRVVKPGCFVCINIGDATRKFGKYFHLFPNGPRIITKMIEIGFINLPEIIWNKPSNSPTKFMGSGTLPAGAYVTLEYEHILIFKKPGKKDMDNENRYESAHFWEERNEWFSNIWRVLGEKQKIVNNSKTRERNAAYPIEISNRLISMFSLKGDIVLDPFFGTGTTAISAIWQRREFVGLEIDSNLSKTIFEKLNQPVDWYNKFWSNRIDRHKQFVEERIAKGKEIKHFNEILDLPVVSKQEVKIKPDIIESISIDEEKNQLIVNYVS